MPYLHTQYSKWTLALAALFLVGIVAMGVAGWSEAIGGPFWYLVFVTIGIVLLVAGRLTVGVDGEHVSAAFGVGWPRRRVALSEVTDARRVRVRWYHGWGIRKVPGGWMYNVRGFDAIEVAVDSGPAFWIGTDDPDGLLAALGGVQPSAV